MEIRYKLTNQNLITWGDCQWVLNEWKETSGNNTLCTDGWLHCYTNPLLAIILNSLHAGFCNPRLFEVEVEGKRLTDNGLKEGWTKMRLIREIEIPKISTEQRIAFGILCTKEVYKNKDWNYWANKWLSGEDRSVASASKASIIAATDSAAAYGSISFHNPKYAIDYNSANAAYNSANAAVSPEMQNYLFLCVASAVADSAAINTLDLIKLVNEAMKVE